MVLKCNNLNKFIDSSTGEIIKKYDPDNKNLIFRFKDRETKEMVDIPASDISIEYGGAISFLCNNERHIIDDGYRDIMCKCGYLVIDNYDIIRSSKETGLELKKLLLEAIKNCYDETKVTNYIEGTCVEVIEDTPNFNYTIRFNSIQNIVNKNEQRRENKITCYPFDKNMDKYGTIFVSIFAQRKLESHDVKSMTKEIDTREFVNFIVNEIKKILPNHSVKFSQLLIKKRLVNWEDI